MRTLEKLLRQDGFDPDSWKTKTAQKKSGQNGGTLRSLLKADGVSLPEPPKIPSMELSSENERSSEGRLNIPNKQQLMDDAWSRMADPSYPAPTGDPIAAAEGAASMFTGGLAWTATTGLSAEQTHKAMRKAQGTPDQYRVKEIDEEAVARGMEDPRLLGLPPGLSRSIAEQLAPRKEVALTPEEMESKRQNFRDTMQQMFSYAPKTQKGQELTEIAVAPFEALHEASKVASKYWLNKAGIDDPVAESVLTDALEIVAGWALFSGATRGRKAYVKSRNAKLTDSRIKKQQRAAQKYLDTLDEFGDPIEAVKKARFDIRSWVDGIVQRFKKDGEISPEAAQKINEMFGEEGNYKGTDIEPLGDHDYERMVRSLEESRGERQAPQRADGTPLETPYVPPKEVDAPKVSETTASLKQDKTVSKDQPSMDLDTVEIVVGPILRNLSQMYDLSNVPDAELKIVRDRTLGKLHRGLDVKEIIRSYTDDVKRLVSKYEEPVSPVPKSNAAPKKSEIESPGTAKPATVPEAPN